MEVNQIWLKRFFDKFDIGEPDQCWDWKDSPNHAGYGLFYIMNKKRVTRPMAHVVAYELVKGKVPEGLELDHLCRNPACVNPYHLEAVTHRENVVRGMNFAGINARKIRCIRGHLLSEYNLIMRPSGARRCRTCHNELRRLKWQTKAA